MDASGDSHSKWNKSEKKPQILYDITCMWNLNYGIGEPICETETYSQT